MISNNRDLGQTSEDAIDRKILLLLAGMGAVLVTAIFYLPLEKTLYFFSDDAYYYFKVASNIVAGHGSTFDSYNLSNGYHPLWMVLILPIYYLTGNSAELSLQLIFTLQVVLGVFSYWFCWMYVYRVMSRYYAVLSLFILAVFASPILIAFNGLESALLLFCLFGILLVDRNYDLFHEISAGKILLTGVLFGFLFMTRLDTAYIIIAFALLKVFGKDRDSGFIKNALALFVRYIPAIFILVLISTPYFLWNYSTFGHLTPISGQIKSSFPYPHLNFNLHAGALPYTLTFIFANLWILAEFLLFRGSNKTFFKTQSAFVKVYWLGVLIHYVWSSLFMQWAVFQWHFTAYIPLLVIFSLHLIKVVNARLNTVGYHTALAAIVCLLSIAYNSIVYIDKGVHLSYVYHSALWFRDNADANTSVALADAGIFGYFSGHPTINLDGLINGYEFQESIMDGSLPNFLKKQHVSYIVHTETGCEYSDKKLDINAYQGKLKYSPVGFSVILDRNDEFYKSPPVRYRPVSENSISCLVIWNLDTTKLRSIDAL